MYDRAMYECCIFTDEEVELKKITPNRVLALAHTTISLTCGSASTPEWNFQSSHGLKKLSVNFKQIQNSVIFELKHHHNGQFVCYGKTMKKKNKEKSFTARADVRVLGIVIYIVFINFMHVVIHRER